MKKKELKNSVEQYTDVDKKIFEGYLKSHGKPVTRRQFLASGLIPGAAALTMPTLYDILTRHNILHAANAACATGGNDMIPILNVNLDGGAAMSGNLIPMDKGGQLMASYSQIGSNDIVNEITRPFGETSAAFSVQSGIAQGIQNTMGLNAQNVAAIGFMAGSTDDSNSNYWGINGFINRAGVAGTILPDLGQNVNQQAYFTPPSALNVGSFADIEAAIGVGGALDLLNKTQKGKLLKVIENLSASQARKLAQQSGGKTLNQLIEDATGLNTELLTANDLGIDPSTNAGFQNVWTDANGNLVNQAQAAVTFNVLNKTSGMGSINMGGYDYHGANNRVTQNTRDLQAGEMVGRIMQSAAILGKPVVVTVTSDGAVSSSDGVNFSSDSGNRGLAMMFLYHPSRKPTVLKGQVGAYKNQVVDTDSSLIIGGNEALATAAMFANYMAFNGKLNETEAATGRLDEINKNYDKLVVVADEKIS
ncbi:MAG: hypothetical protein KDD50_00520 [Bdellovibrionales bacterium]|nr:hypothetical protein [Bdellovibrionales bacterium]